MAETNAEFFRKDEDSIDDGVQESAFFSRGYCCFFWYYPHFYKYSRQSDYWERISSSERDFITRGWWNEGINAFKKARECSELVAGPKWKTFIRRFNKTPAGRSKSMKFHYDPLSYAQNFDEGPGHNCQFHDHHSFRNSSSRYAANPGHKGSQLLETPSFTR